MEGEPETEESQLLLYPAVGPNTTGYILTKIDEIRDRSDPHSSYSRARGVRLLGKRGQLGKEPSDHVIKWASPFLWQREPDRTNLVQFLLCSLVSS